MQGSCKKGNKKGDQKNDVRVYVRIYVLYIYIVVYMLIYFSIYVSMYFYSFIHLLKQYNIILIWVNYNNSRTPNFWPCFHLYHLHHELYHGKSGAIPNVSYPLTAAPRVVVVGVAFRCFDGLVAVG